MISLFGTWLVRALHATLRVKHVRVEKLQALPQSIIAFWHAHLLMMLHSRYKRPILVMISQSKDGDLIANTLHRYGAQSARGSSTRGGPAALRETIRAGRQGMNIAFTPDGPKGPPRVAKDGVVYAAQATGLPIVPVVFAAKKKRFLHSWDRMVIPMPFTRAIFLYGDPMVVPREGDVEEWRVKVESAMNSLADEAEQMFDELWRRQPTAGSQQP